MSIHEHVEDRRPSDRKLPSVRFGLVLIGFLLIAGTLPIPGAPCACARIVDLAPDRGLSVDAYLHARGTRRARQSR